MSVSHRLNVFAKDTDGEPSVWLDTESGDMDGICLGTGATAEEALRDAREELAAALTEVDRQLQGGAV